MANGDFLEKERRRQKERVEALRAKQNNEFAEAPKQDITEAEPANKWENFWYYNKFKVIAAVFLIVTLSVIISQCATKEKYDYTVVLLAKYDFTDGQIEDIEKALAEYGEDRNGNGRVSVQVVNCAYGNGIYTDMAEAKKTKLAATIAGDETALLFLTDMAGYEDMCSRYSEFFEALGLPENDGKSISLPKSFYDKIEFGDKIPQDLVLSRRKVGKDMLIAKKKGVKSAWDSADKLLNKVAEK